MSIRDHRGSKNPNSRLDEDQIADIRAAKGIRTAKELSKLHGVHVVTIYKIWKKERWK